MLQSDFNVANRLAMNHIARVGFDLVPRRLSGLTGDGVRKRRSFGCS